MNWSLFASTYLAIFLAEMGDKTQLATMSLAGGQTARWTVFLASALALVTTTAIAVLTGEGLSRIVPPIWIRRGAGLLFVGIGLWFLLTRPE